MQTFAAIVISVGLAFALMWLPIPGIWWLLARWALYLPIVMVAVRNGSLAGLGAGMTALLLCAFVVVFRGVGDMSWLSIFAPDFVIVGWLGGFLRGYPGFRPQYSAPDPDPWPGLSRISEPEIAFDLNPLASIESAARLLGESDASADLRQELVDIILKESGYLSANITGLLRQRRDSTPLQVSEADIRPIIETAVREAEFVISGRGIVLRKQVAPDVPPIQCNPDQIRNLFLSLIINAAQSTSERTEVVLDVRCGHNGVVFDVRGQRPFVSRLASRFFGSRPGASGAGLAATLDIVRRQGGRIVRKGNVRKGLEFSVWLPLRRNEPNGGWQGVGSGG
jgi:hypothetical protein